MLCSIKGFDTPDESIGRLRFSICEQMLNRKRQRSAIAVTCGKMIPAVEKESQVVACEGVC